MTKQLPAWSLVFRTRSRHTGTRRTVKLTVCLESNPRGSSSRAGELEGLTTISLAGACEDFDKHESDSRLK